MSKKTRRKQLSERVMKAKRREKPVDKKPNPFELKFNKQKHAVAGQKKKNAAVGLPLLSRHRAHQHRKETLLTEYQRFGKANQIIDRRLGERNVNLTPDQKMALRFAAERRRRYKGHESTDDRLPSSSNFQLTGVESILTHRGKALSEIEKLNDRPILDDDEDDDQGFGADFVKLAHFGGAGARNKDAEEDGDGEDGKKKSRKDLIEEMIANSKRARYEMQMQREKASDLTADLDAQWKEAVRENLVSKWIRNKDDDEDPEHHRHHAGCGHQQEKAQDKVEKKKKDETLDYDRLVHEMTFEPKAAKAGEKLKEAGDDTESKEGEEKIDSTETVSKKGSKALSRNHVTGDDDLSDFQRFKQEKEKPFVVQYDSEGRLIRDDDANDTEESIPSPAKKTKAIGIEFLEPRIETNFNPERKKKRPLAKGETVERQKLVQQYKKEFRGTVRELRRDNAFLARQQLIEQQQLDSERRRKVKNLMKSLVSQETECNKLKKKKK